MFAFLANNSFANATELSGEAAFKSWSGYWWPANRGALGTGDGYRGRPAPLQKYDMLVNGAYDGLATEEYLTKHYNPNALNWEGLCGAYSLSAVQENYEFAPSVEDNIVFRTGDKKGLMTAAHILDWTEAIIQNCETPEVLHYWLLNYIKDKGVAFTAELDPGVEVWNYPIYKFSMSISETDSTMNVQCKIWYADDLVEPDYLGTKELTKNYQYRLLKDNGVIIGGEWIGSSEYDHPQKLTFPLARKTSLQNIDYEKIKYLAGRKDDSLESELPVAIAPGEYRLLLMNEDVYLIDLENGDTSNVCINKEEGGEDISLSIVASDGEDIYSGTIEGKICFQLSGDKAPFTIKLSQQDYTKFGIYTISMDSLRSFDYANPRILKGNYWSGLAIVNDTDVACKDINIVGTGRTGQPIQTLLGPFSLSPGEKRVIMPSLLPVRNIDKQELNSIKISASSKLNLAYMHGGSLRTMSAMQNQSAAKMLIMPDTLKNATNSKRIVWGLYNNSFDQNSVEMVQLDKNGGVTDSQTLSCTSRQMIHYTEGVETPFSSKIDDGWVLLKTSDPMSGYVQWTGNNAMIMESLPLLRPGNDFIIPHSVSSSFWQTRIVIINVSDSTNIVNAKLINGDSIIESSFVLSPFEKKRLSLTDLFPAATDFEINAGSITIVSANDSAGYFAYETINDSVFYPFLRIQDMRTHTVIPHVSNEDGWWTGVGLFNPHPYVNHLRLVPYNASGIPDSEGIMTVAVPAKSKYVINLSDVNQGAEVDYYKVDSLSGNGFYLIYSIGDNECTKLSGGIAE